ncbi:inactive rhomboid protein 1-like [Montipora foliosa]|uniref:inactive rhomboid protein 1-like n=1 Tax=Montipora foliosa TaxID=591990 RepID=UPI0035F1321A
MERDPLLGKRKSGGSSRSGSGLLHYSNPPSSDENTEYSVYSYHGDNYVVPPDRRTSLSYTIDTQNSNEEFQPRRFHRPLFISTVTLVHCGLLIYICISGGIEPISFKPKIEGKKIHKFGFIASGNNGSKFKHQEEISRYSGVNAFIGPNASILVQAGAKFVPCMKKLNDIKNRTMAIEKREADYSCCSFNKECAMMSKKSCPGKIIGSTNCNSSDDNCANGITLRPCCVGLHVQCYILSKQYCLFVGGHWHDDKLLCHDVNCLNDICGMSGGLDKDGGDQWYRLVTAIFLHLGIIHLITNLLFQIPVGILIEREIGTVRTFLIYMISGIGGNLICGLFNPLSPQVGASGALFGLVALLIIKLLQLRHDVRRPCMEALIFLGVALISFAIGTLPYIGNFVHIGGFLFGSLASLALLPRTNSRFTNLGLKSCQKVVFMSLLIIALVCAFVAFFVVKKSEFCSWCKYIDCIPYVKNFCPSMDSDGYSDSGDVK